MKEIFDTDVTRNFIERDKESSSTTPKFEGPLSGEMWNRVNQLNSRMPDEFDWSVYDSLYKKFGDNQPRGGVVFKTALKLVNHHSSCSKCHYAFEIDTYGRGCVHNCVYCYALESLTGRGYWNRPHPFPLDMSLVRQIFYQVFETDRKNKWRSIMEKRVPLRIGSMSDSFMKMDKKFGVTKELLKILSFYDYPYIIFTRSDLVASDEYMGLLRKDLASVQFSISGDNEKLTKAIEPGAPSYTKRLKALETLNSNGFWTTVRVNPFFPMYPDGYYTDHQSIIERFGSRDNAPKFDLFDWTMLKELKQVGVPSLLAGVVRLSPMALKGMSRSTGINLKSFFKPELIKGSYDVRYSDAEVNEYYKQFWVKSQEAGIRFNTCYIGMGTKDYFQYQKYWSNKKDCCDARTNLKTFNSSSQDISWGERLKHSPCKPEARKAQNEEGIIEKEYSRKINGQSEPKKGSGGVEIVQLSPS